MATLSDINSKISSITGMDTNSYTNANRLIDINRWYQKVQDMILDSQDEADFDDSNRTDYPRYTFPLTTNRDYSISSTYGALKIKELSIAYDGVNYYRANPLDYAELEIGDAPASATAQNAAIDNYFSRTSPRYDFKFNSIYLYPKATSTDVSSSATGLLEFYRTVTDFTLSDLTTGTASPGFDKPYHMLLAYGPAWDYSIAVRLPQANDIQRELMDYEMRLRKAYSAKENDRKYKLVPGYVSYK